MKKALYRLETYYKRDATESEKEFLMFVINNTREAVEMDIHALAKKCYCSAATIIRICKKNGFTGFKELKRALLNDINLSNELIQTKLDPSKDSTIQNVVTEVFNNNIQAIHNTYALLDMEELEKIVDLIIKSNSLYLFGVGASFVVAKDLQQKFERVNKRTVLFEDFHMQLITSNNIVKNDVVIIISYSGLTKEMIEIAKNVKSRGGILIAITKYGSSKLLSMSDYNLYVVEIEGLLRTSAAASRIAQLTMVDTLFQAYIRKTKTASMEKVLSTKQLLNKEE